jgi:hypothetical protein
MAKKGINVVECIDGYLVSETRKKGKFFPIKDKKKMMTYIEEKIDQWEIEEDDEEDTDED